MSAGTSNRHSEVDEVGCGGVLWVDVNHDVCLSQSNVSEHIFIVAIYADVC